MSNGVCEVLVCFGERQACMAVKAWDLAPNSYRAALEMGWVWDKGLSLALSCHS